MNTSHLKRYFIVIVIFLSFSVSLYPQESDIWTSGNARIIPYKEFSAGVLNPVRYSAFRQLEFSSHLLYAPLIPNFSAKKYWTEFKEVLITSKHTVAYPSPALNFFNDPKFGGFVEPGKDFSSIIHLNTEFLFSRWLFVDKNCDVSNYLLTFKIGGRYALNTPDNAIPEVRYPYFFHRTYIYGGYWGWYTGFDLDGRFSKNLDFKVNVDFISAGMATDYFAIENTGLLIFNLNKKFKIAAGYKGIYCTLPEKKSLNVFPLIDVLYYFSWPKGDEKNLFGSKPF